MAKRARGSTIRPGQRAPKPRGTTAARPTTTTSAVAPTPSPNLTADEEARAAALEAQIVADEKATDDASRRSRDRGRRIAEDAVRPSSIAIAASQEYAYVARDIRRIVIIGGSLIALLVALWVVVAITGIGPF